MTSVKGQPLQMKEEGWEGALWRRQARQPNGSTCVLSTGHRQTRKRRSVLLVIKETGIQVHDHRCPDDATQSHGGDEPAQQKESEKTRPRRKRCQDETAGQAAQVLQEGRDKVRPAAKRSRGAHGS